MCFSRYQRVLNTLGHFSQSSESLFFTLSFLDCWALAARSYALGGSTPSLRPLVALGVGEVAAAATEAALVLLCATLTFSTVFSFFFCLSFSPGSHCCHPVAPFLTLSSSSLLVLRTGVFFGLRRDTLLPFRHI